MWWIAGGVVAVLALLSPRYGWHRGELYFLEAGRHLAWGYVDQPPFTPLVARIVDELVGPNLFALRLIPASATAATIVLGALFVRELGGDRRDQVVGAAAVAAGGSCSVSAICCPPPRSTSRRGWRCWWWSRASCGPGTSAGGRIGINAALSIPLALPVLPLFAMGLRAGVNEAVAETVGWKDLTDQVAAVVGGLPADEQERVILVAATYGEAGALDLHGPDHGLPPAHSPHNGYADFRRPTDDGGTVVAVRYERDDLERHFEDCEQVTRVDNDHGIDNEVRGAPVVVCRGLRSSWAELWPQLRRLS